MFSKIIISGDVLRPFQEGAFYTSATCKNIRWLHALLAPVLHSEKRALSRLSWDEDRVNDAEFFDTPALYQALGLPLNLTSWARLAVSDRVPEALIEMLRAPLRQALVIGYELPNVLINALNVLGTPFIDLVLNPVRFLPDLVFSFRTNIADYHQLFNRCRLQPGQIAQQLGFLQAKNAWMPKPGIIAPPGSALIVEQVATDMSVVRDDGRFASLEDHIPRLHDIISSHPAVFYKPHPYALNRNSIARMKAIFPVMTLCESNIYHLLMQPEIEKVVALNSGALVEAAYFGKETENLMPWRYHHDDAFTPQDGAPGALIPLSDCWLTADFWRDLFEGKTHFQPSGIWQPDRLRRAMNADWGFHFINRVVV